MHILVQGYAPGTPAGMGIVLENIARRLAGFGHDITWVSPNGTQRTWNECRIVPVPQVGQTGLPQVLNEVIQNQSPDVYLTNMNWQSLQQLPEVLNQHYMNSGEELPVVLHTPIESESPPPGFHQRIIEDHLNPVHLLPFTEPSYEMFDDAEWCQDFVAHGISSTFYNPPHRSGIYREGTQENTKIVAINAGNERRKNLDRWLKAAGIIRERYDEPVRFVMHTSPQPKRGDPLFGGWELPRIARDEGLSPGDDIIWTKSYALQGVSEDQIDFLYGDADVYLSLSGGEGFGLPVAEALSRGTPCVLTDHVNHRWVAGPGGTFVEAEDSTRMRTGEELLLPDVQDAAEKTIALLDDGGWQEEDGQAGQEHVEKFRWEKTVSKLITYLETEVTED